MQNTGPGLVVGIVLIVVLVIVLFGGAGMMGFGGLGMMGPGMMGRYGGMMGGYGAQGFGFNPLGAILTLFFWAFIIGGVVLLVIWLARASTVAQHAGRTAGAPSGETALDILKMRYARGEITKEQFNAISRDVGA